MSGDLLPQLRERFGGPGLSFSQLDSGPVLHVDTAHCTAAVAFHGAHILNWAPKDAAEVLFTSQKSIFQSGVPVRGGVPVCWPWFNAHPSDAAAYAHGFARRTLWRLEEASCGSAYTTVCFALVGDAGVFPHWPHPVDVRLTIRLGEVLEMALQTANRSDTPFVVAQALHTYFAVGDIHTATVTGLEGGHYQDDVAGGTRAVQSGPISFGPELDRVYLDTAATCWIVDPALQRRIRIEKEGSQTTVVWNPGAALAAKMSDMEPGGHQRFVCVEATNALDDHRRILPGESHSLVQRISCEPL
ncbi:MAG: D-hexose-6-phosphate mutarotase [Proteobacteria bacterium]|nr:D-hexose-6-phosphate mutarotase [Pseudomonadota bacterium]